MAILKKFKKLFRRKRRKTQRKYPTYNKRQPVLESKQKSSHEQAHSRPPRHRRKKSAFKRWFWRMFRKMALYGGALALVGYMWFSIGLPNIDDLNKFKKTPSIVIKAQDGQIIGSFGDVYGDYLSFAELPTSLVDAVMATEDRNFNHHFGIDPIGLALNIVSVLLGWFTIHTMAGLHYAYEYYERPETSADGDGVVGGLEFPAGDEPDGWAFLYFSFVIGMTAQVADIAVSSNAMRRRVLLHGVFSFLFNTVIVAATVNAVLSLAGTGGS